MDYKSVVYNAARDGNLNRLKVGLRVFLLGSDEHKKAVCSVQNADVVEEYRFSNASVIG